MRKGKRLKMQNRLSWRLLSLFLLIFVSSAISLIAQETRFKTWNTENGLPQNSVNSIAQTRDGYIWLATFDGLARFDGVRFKVFRKQDTPELPTNRLRATFVDHEGRLWILTEDANTVVSYYNGRFTSFTKGRDFEADDIFAPWQIRGEMVFRSKDVEFRFEDGAFQRHPLSTRRNLPTLFADQNQSIWIDIGDAYLTGADERLERVPKQEKMPFDGLTVYDRRFAVIDDCVWFFMPRGKHSAHLARLRNGELKVFQLDRSNAAIVQVDREKNLWIADYGARLLRIDSATVALADPSNFPLEEALPGIGAPGTTIRDLFTDREGNLWICSEKGLHLLRDTPPIQVYSTANGLPSENIYSVVEDHDGNIWFGAWPGYLIRYTNGKFFPEPFPLVTAIFEDRVSRLWVGSSGIRIRDKDKWIDFEPFPLALRESITGSYLGEIDVISQDSESNIWFGGADIGIVRYNGNATRQFSAADGLPGMSVTSFLQTKSGTKWVGTATGLARLEGDHFVSYTTANGLGGNYIRSLYEDSEGTLWIGTYESGITRFKDGKFATVTTKQGLFSDGVFCILEDDDGWFWMNSNQGIHRTRRRDLNDVADGRKSVVTSASYGPEDGLRNVEGNGGKQPAGLKASDGKLWFPTAGGIAVVDPRKARTATVPPPVLIEEVMIDQSTVIPSAGAVRLEPGRSVINVNYTALAFRGAEGIRFRYRLEGVDVNWTEAGDRRTANFSHIPYGEYTFHVIAANSDGLWNTDGATLRIVVVAPFYRTYWFYTLATLTAALILTSAYFYRVRQLQAINDERADFTRRLIDSQEHERRRIALELHDSLGQSLTIIRNRALLSLKKTDEHELLIEQLREISDASVEALRETREIARNLHPPHIENLGLPAALASLVESIENGTSILFTKKIDYKIAPVSNDEAINIYRIAQESLSNIIKHSNAKMATIVLLQTDDRLTLFIEDDGIGFSGDGSHSGMGLKGVHERAGIIGAQLKIHSDTGKGTRITVSLSNNGRTNTNSNS